MSAIQPTRMNFFPIVVLLMFFSCHKEPEKPGPASSGEISQIILSYVGGNRGSYMIIKVSQDSIHVEKGNTTDKSHTENNKAISEATWKQLIKPIDIRTLNKIRSSPSQQSVDRTDETFQVKTRNKVHVYVNAYTDTLHYRQLEHFKIQLEKILPTDHY
ncbi:hypothetical protein [uncultured Chryseobacterium sp.]|uniref:hypothetical protein n=1 Tax=uncultured Chryseobacterium sp. TaxID=259322 RepID=UPI0025D365ED|nr:hypothetical protein [uncultured Chryseobacterium sp.]